MAEWKPLPEKTKEGKGIIYLRQAGRTPATGYQIVDPKTGEGRGSLSRIDVSRREIGGVKQNLSWVFLPSVPEVEASIRRTEEAKETAALAQKEAEFEAKRIAEGKIKTKDVVLTQPGSKVILQKILRERARKEAEERAKFPTKAERIEQILVKKATLEKLKRQKARERLIQKQITKRKEIEGPDIFLDPETARKVRAQLAGKEIQKTVLRAEFPDLRSFMIEEKRFAVIEAEQPFPPGLITTETKLISFFQAKKRKEAEIKIEEFEVILETPAKIGVAFEKEGKALAGASLIFIGKTAETAFGISPPGIVRSIQKRGLLETTEQFTGIPLIRAIKEGRLLKATTPAGRAAEAVGIGTGVVIGSRVTRASFRGAKKVLSEIQKEGLKLRAAEFEPEVRAEKVKGFEPVGKGQQRFIKITESGQEIPQFRESFPQVVRAIISKKTGKITRVIDPISGKVIRGTVIKDIQKTLDIKTKEVTITDKTLIARELEPIPGRKPIPKLKPEPLGKQIKLGKIKEGFLDRELFDIEFQVPTTPSKFGALLRSKKAGAILEPPALKAKMISAFDREVPKGIEPITEGLFLVPPILEEEEKREFKPGLDIGRKLRREQEKELITPSLFEKEQIKELDQRLKEVTKLKPKVGVEEDIIRESIREREIKRELIIIPEIGAELETPLEKELKLDIIPKPPPKPPLPKGVVLPPSLPRERFREPEEEDLFFVKAKSKGEFVKLNKKALPKNKALNLGAEAVDNTASATFKLISAREKGKDVVDDIGFNKRDKFTKKNSVYIEKNKHRIDSMGEHLGITVKGWLAQRKRGLRI